MPENEIKRTRIVSVDLFRGLVMVIMLLDHTREYVNADSFLFSPTDLSKTTTALFFTRWITHFCARRSSFWRVRVFISTSKGEISRRISRFLFTRGLWLIVLEFTIVRFAIFFDLDYSLFGVAEVIWIFGISIILMAGMVWLRVAVSAIFGLVLIFGHNLLDSFSMGPAMAAPGSAPGRWQTIWIFLHQPGMVPMIGGAINLFVAYPLIPWVGVMATGYALEKSMRGKTKGDGDFYSVSDLPLLHCFWSFDT